MRSDLNRYTCRCFTTTQCSLRGTPAARRAVHNSAADSRHVCLRFWGRETKCCEIVRNLSLLNKFANDCNELECAERSVTSCVRACVCVRDNVIRRKWHVQKWSPVTMLPTITRTNTALCLSYRVSNIINMSYNELRYLRQGNRKVTVSWDETFHWEVWYL